jgi:hypothetical protein
MSTTLETHNPAQLRDAWIEVHGRLNAAAAELLEQSPSYFARVLDFTAHAWRHGPLEPKVKVLILLSGIGMECFALALPALRAGAPA